jgi:hypothetical protein
MDRREFLKGSVQVAVAGLAMQSVARAEEPTAKTSSTNTVRVELEFQFDEHHITGMEVIKIKGKQGSDLGKRATIPDNERRKGDEEVRFVITEGSDCYYVWNRWLNQWVWVCH